MKKSLLRILLEITARDLSSATGVDGLCLSPKCKPGVKEE